MSDSEVVTIDSTNWRNVHKIAQRVCNISRTWQSINLETISTLVQENKSMFNKPDFEQNN